MTESVPSNLLQAHGSLNLLIRASSALPSDFGEAMPVLFEIGVDPRRLEAWLEVVDAVTRYELSDLFEPFLSTSRARGPVSVEVSGADGGFHAVPNLVEADRIFGERSDEPEARFRLRPRGDLSSRLDLRAREIKLRIAAEGVQWTASLTDVEQQVAFRTPPLGALDILALRLQMSPPEAEPEIFRAMVVRDPYRASLALARGVPDPWSADPSARRPLHALPMRVLLPLLRHANAEIRSRAAHAVNLPPGG